MAYQEIKAGRLRTFKLGKLVMVAGEDAFAWSLPETLRLGAIPVI